MRSSESPSYMAPQSVAYSGFDESRVEGCASLGRNSRRVVPDIPVVYGGGALATLAGERAFLPRGVKHSIAKPSSVSAVRVLVERRLVRLCLSPICFLGSEWRASPGGNQPCAVEFGRPCGFANYCPPARVQHRSDTKRCQGARTWGKMLEPVGGSRLRLEGIPSARGGRLYLCVCPQCQPT